MNTVVQHRRTVARRGLAAGLLLIADACESATKPVPAATVEVALAFTAMSPTQTAQATATVKDAAGTILAGRVIAWSSSNPTVATVNSTSGAVIAVGPGLTQISATLEGKTGSAQLTVCHPGILPPTGTATTIHVSATLGTDGTGTGSCAAPYKTITRGVAGLVSGATVRVGPGTYNAALGEVFPIMLPAGVFLIGDEANKGQGTAATRVVGGGLLTLAGPCGTFGSTIYAGANAVIAGLEMTTNQVSVFQMTLLLRNDNVTLRNNSIVGIAGNPGSVGSAVYICNASRNHVITGNRIRDNASLGLGFIGGGVGSKVEGNVITLNSIGVEYDTAGGDLGGGTAGSIGGNIISCNSRNDLWTKQSITITASNNLWDHVPPSLTDIYNGDTNDSAIIILTGATVAPNNCP